MLTSDFINVCIKVPKRYNLRQNVATVQSFTTCF